MDGPLPHGLNSNNGQVIATGNDAGFTQTRERLGVGSRRNFPLEIEQRLVLEHQDWVIVPDGGTEQSVHVLDAARDDDLHPGNVEEPVLNRLRVLARVPAAL